MKSLNPSAIPMRLWLAMCAGRERAAVLVPAHPVASSTWRTLGGHTPIVSKAGLGATKVSTSVLPSARGSDGGGAPRSAVCRWQPVVLGAEQVTRAPTTTFKPPPAINPVKKEKLYE